MAKVTLDIECNVKAGKKTISVSLDEFKDKYSSILSGFPSLLSEDNGWVYLFSNVNEVKSREDISECTFFDKDIKTYSLGGYNLYPDGFYDDLAELFGGEIIIAGSIFLSFDGSTSYFQYNIKNGSRKWYSSKSRSYRAPDISYGVPGKEVQSIKKQENEKKLKWKFETGNNVNSSPVVSDGVVYFGSGYHLYAVDIK